mgnify:FL=1
MSKPTGVKLKDYCKAVETCIVKRGYSHVKDYDNGGSMHTFEIFEKKNDSVPAIVWSIHFGHNKKKELFSDDLKKIYNKTAVPKEEFIEALKNITGKNSFNIG